MTKSCTSFGFLTVAVFMTIVNFNTAKNMTIFPEKFEMRKKFDSCDKVEFVVKNITGDFGCMMKCTKNDSCKGVFSDPSTGHCVGCSQAGPSRKNGDIINGTYFEVRPKPVVKSCEGRGWMKFQGFCYFFTQQPGFQAALDDCRRPQGADIAVIENKDENDFLIERAKDGGAKFYVMGVVSDPQVMNGTWIRYNTTIPVTYLPWHTGEPNNISNSVRYASLHRYRNYEWADVRCQRGIQNVHMICKMSSMYRIA